MKKQHIENIRLFFEHDWPIIQNRAHISFVDIKSPVISGMPTGSMNGNSNDDKYSIHIQAQHSG
ncbi:hypothetical protein [Weissella hellenica]|uniref:hypothetical protein n=1 Tax=Weissella hellenica TaxID=46256 RepID=UPI0009F27444|nr:hypothetical protein [Weissella hellenica]GED35272.1 hypothetical protein WHE01_01760 [Weissella hellenica]